ncbi:MAG TPA: ABC transporter ATP-binding protein [Usitatibacter sp.]|jgi:lipopolysaccharide transport system ATP-binding protein|nr:ABC transporter ATP-binding protein [Usitatibacter sp.]
MAGTAVISVSHVTKRYRVFERPAARLANVLWGGGHDAMREVTALDDVSFEIGRGESVALIGRNGSGKSTLLEILAGTLSASAGTTAVNGRVCALLELGSGFNPEYSGRENVILGGLLLGFERAEILRRFDEIAAFAEIGDAIERPVKTYSSGMMMRLAFAVQVLADPDILIVDEALSVGDFFFQQKCFRHIRGLVERGVTLLFVSHDMRTVRDLCSRALYLREGKLVFDGDAPAAIRQYLAEGESRLAHTSVLMPSLPDSGAIPEDLFWRRPRDSTPGPLLAVRIVDAAEQSVSHALMGETIRVRVYFHALDTHAGSINLLMKNRYDQVVTMCGSSRLGSPPVSSGSETFAVYEMEIDLMLEAGLYSLQLAYSRPVAANKGDVLDNTDWIGPFEVRWDYDRDTAPFLGMFGLPIRGRLLPRAAASATTGGTLA